MAWIQSLARELVYARGAAIKGKRKKKKKNEEEGEKVTSNLLLYKN